MACSGWEGDSGRGWCFAVCCVSPPRLLRAGGGQGPLLEGSCQVAVRKVAPPCANPLPAGHSGCRGAVCSTPPGRALHCTHFLVVLALPGIRKSLRGHLPPRPLPRDVFLAPAAGGTRMPTKSGCGWEDGGTHPDTGTSSGVVWEVVEEHRASAEPFWWPSLCLHRGGAMAGPCSAPLRATPLSGPGVAVGAAGCPLPLLCTRFTFILGYRLEPACWGGARW